MFLSCKSLISGRQTAFSKMLLADGVGYPLNSYNLFFLMNTSELDQPVMYLARGYTTV